MTGKTSPRVGEARDITTNHYVFEASVRLRHWLTVSYMSVLMVTGYFIDRPLLSVSGEATYLFYMGDIRLMHFAVAMVFTVILLMYIHQAFVGNRYSRELFIVSIWWRSWWQGAYSMVRWYLFPEKEPEDGISHNPIAQAMMCGYFLLSVLMILIGFALYSEHSQYAIFTLFRYMTELLCRTGGNSSDIHSRYRLGMWFIAALIVGHVHMTIHGDTMSDETAISTMINGLRSHKSPKGQHDKEVS